MQQHCYYSMKLALQIKAALEGALPPEYLRLPAPNYGRPVPTVPWRLRPEGLCPRSYDHQLENTVCFPLDSYPVAQGYAYSENVFRACACLR